MQRELRHPYKQITVESAADIVLLTRAPTRRRVDIDYLVAQLNNRLHEYRQLCLNDGRSRAEALKLLKLVASRANALDATLTKSRFSSTLAPALVAAANRLDTTGKRFSNFVDFD